MSHASFFIVVFMKCYNYSLRLKLFSFKLFKTKTLHCNKTKRYKINKMMFSQKKNPAKQNTLQI